MSVEKRGVITMSESARRSADHAARRSADATCLTAIVSTQRHAHATLHSFLRWHLHGLHFDHVFLYFDDPADDAASIEVAQSQEFSGCVTVLKATPEFRVSENYAELPSWRSVASSVTTMVQSRQRLNCEHCVRLCASAGIRWLLHIDADELFMPPHGEDARAHFQRI